jgi:glycosyltransferase involved in cell wall biosynthesis
VNNKHDDLVSVILPVYNGEEFLEQAIKSITTQTHINLELIVLDDGSTDNSKLIALEHAKKDRRLRVISRENKGLGATLNELIGLSRGEYIARMDSDDISHPDRLQNQLDFMKKNPNCVMLGGQINFLVGDAEINAFPMPVTHDQIREGLLDARFPICHPSIMFRKSTAIRVGGYLVEGAGEDLDFFLRMSEAGSLCNTTKKVLKYRIQTNSLSIKKAGELSKAYSLALYNATLREKKLSEIKMDQFEKDHWEKRGFLIRAKEKAYSFSEILYRKYIICRSNNRSLESAIFLALAAILRPATTKKRILEILKLN